MSEVEFDQLLDVVSATIGAQSRDTLSLDTALGELPHAANDNGLEWPLVPFPSGWCASC